MDLTGLGRLLLRTTCQCQPGGLQQGLDLPTWGHWPTTPTQCPVRVGPGSGGGLQHPAVSMLWRGQEGGLTLRTL